MPVLVEVRIDPHLQVFYDALLNRHKARLQAIIAVDRKLLHAICGFFAMEQLAIVASFSDSRSYRCRGIKSCCRRHPGKKRCFNQRGYFEYGDASIA